MNITLGLGLGQRTRGDSAPQIALTQITITPFSRDRTLFDSGAAFGRNEALVPVSGTGTPGETVQIRLVDDDGSATVWEDIAQIDAGGDWTATVQQVRSAGWLRPEVRVKSETITRASGLNRFGVGHVIALWGQSEVVRIRSLTYNLIPAEPLLADDMVQALWLDGSPVVKHLTDVDPHTAALAAMANVFIEERPDDKFALIFHAVSGTSFRALVDDANPSRTWSDDAALHGFATADGQHVGMPAASWFASPAALADSFDDALFPLFTGKALDGTPINFPTTISYGTGASFAADHWFGELYDPAHTRWVPYGPHRFEIGTDMQSAKITATGATQDNLSNKQAARQSWRSMVQNPNAGTWFLPMGAEPLAYRNGVSDGAGGWTDQSHPSGNTDDGTAMFARHCAHAILQSSGLTTWPVPAFDQCLWESSGAYVEVWSTAGPVTTLRAARGEVALGSSFAHWTDVLGWQINGVPAQRAELVAGRVRLYPLTGAFTASDRIAYGEGGATGMIKFPEDFYAGCYKNIPLVDVGAARVEGIAVTPLPAAAVLANTLPAAAASFTTSATGPHFVDPLNLGAGVSQIQFVFDLAVILPASGARTLATTTGNYLKLEVLPAGQLRIRVRDADGIVKVNNVQSASGFLTDGVRASVVFATDLTAGFARVWVNGVLALGEAFTPGSGFLPADRSLLLMATANGATQIEGEIYSIGVWKAATTNGSTPAAASYKSITGPASVANGDLWKSGSNAV